ncbi:MAG: ERF family protein [Clostridia bacterium]|nr:ERF family protein [Clostridia bacterium]
MIAEKIIKIMEEVQPVIQLDDDQYGVEKAIQVIHPLLIKYKVIIIPLKILNCSTTNSNKSANIGMLYQFIDAESKEKEAIEVEILGGGFDEKGNRAIYNALSGAYRYALQQVFAFTVKDRDDVEKSNDNKEEGQAVNQASGNNVEPSKEEPKDVNELTSDELDNLFRFDSEVA